MKLQRVWAIAYNTWLESVRERLWWLLVVLVGLLWGISYLIPFLAPLGGAKILMDVELATIHLFSLVIAIWSASGAINQEIEKRTIYTLLAKPIRRTEFLLGKHLGLAGVVGVVIILMTLCFMGIYQMSSYGSVVSLQIPSILLAMLFTYLELLLLLAAALLFGSFTSSLLAVLLTFALYLVGHFSQSLLQLGAISKNPTIGIVTRILYVLLPDLERFNLRQSAVFALLPTPSELWVTACYGLTYTAVLLIMAQLSFGRREF